MSNTKTLILPSTYPADFSPPKSSPHHRLRRRFGAALHIGGLVASLIAIALFSAAIPKWNANFFHNTGPASGDWTDGLPLGPLGFAFLYHATVVIHARIRTRSVLHPSTQEQMVSSSRRSVLTHTTFSGLVLLSLPPALFLAGYGSLFRVWRPAVRTQSGLLVCNMLNIFARECEPVLYSIGNLQIGAIVFGSLVWAIHFSLLLDALRGWRRYMLVRQLQRQKLSHYGGHETLPKKRRSHGRSRGGHGSRHSSRLGTVSDAGQHGRQQYWAQARPASGSTRGSRTGALFSTDGTGDEPRQSQTLAGPPPQESHFIQPPEPSHHAVPRR
ncbi:hypothetical protein A1O1_03969 [Capronia coronata CBS 617.96]|uniref:Uncharacterized protein n=1 Tax=Capronia coronata CBS 617.96 TaxID=1182541 RepID=W9Z8Q1_9EURO|nr:uncharacterized protein A1O1_03969 [Capronia coronata CBS 617.96]EXJ90864.1 hypothetical protein A1O1_03969 [Capronia coronata CBS 617.96]